MTRTTSSISLPSGISDIELQHKPWKIAYSPTITKPSIGIYSFFDLFFYEKTVDVDGVKKTYYYPRHTGKKTTEKGLSLDHDIICYNSTIYGSDGITVNTNDQNNNTLQSWLTYGFDIGVVNFDPRAKPRPIDVYGSKINYSSNGSSETRQKYTIYVYDKEAAIYPATSAELTGCGLSNDTNAFYDRMRSIYAFNRGSSDVGNELWKSFGYLPYTVGTYDSNADIIISEKDSTFSKTLITDNENAAYNKFALNYKNLFHLFYRTIAWSNQGLSNNNIPFLKSNSNSFIPIFSAQATNASVMYDAFHIKSFFDGSNAIKFYTDTINANGIDLSNTSSEYYLNNVKSIVDILKHTYVWIRCPFFGDYVKPDDFNQELNTEADVKHRNIMASSKGDFNRYDDRSDTLSEYDNDAYKSDNSLPYMVQTAPSEDLLSDLIASQASISGYNKDLTEYSNFNSEYDENKKNEFAKLIEDLQRNAEKEDESIIGSLWNETMDRDYAIEQQMANKAAWESIDSVGFESINHLSNPLYFDPNSRKNWNIEKHVPVLVPSSGNIIADGRILSPSIDEIWVYFKKLVDGHDSDEINFNVASERDTGLIVNGFKSSTNKDYQKDGVYINDFNSFNTKDTRLKEGQSISFNNEIKNGNIISKGRGDPIGVTIEVDDKNRKQIKVTNWVSPPDTFKYIVYDFILQEDKKLRTFENRYDNGNLVDHSFEENTACIRLKEQNSDQNNNRGYVKLNILTDEQTGEQIINKTYTGNNSLDTNINSSVPKNILRNGDLISGVDSTIYGPREKPYSLRELEAAIKNCKFNLNSLMRYLVVNFTVNNQLIKHTYVNDNTTEGFRNRNGSGLYQFHKLYNGQSDNPNTFFNQDKVKHVDSETNEVSYENYETPENGIPAQFDDKLKEIRDYNDKRSQEKDKKSLFEQEYVKITNSAYYGSHDSLPQSNNEYASKDVYLAADGTWRYIFDQVRVPTLDVDY